MKPLTIHAAAAAFGALFAGTACAEPLGFAPWFAPRQPQPFQQMIPQRDTYEPADETRAMPAQLRRQIVSYPTREAPGTIVIDTPATRLYYVLGGGKAIAYGIGVGREGFTWSGVQTISRKSEWPDWIPPQEMLQRQPYLPRFIAGGPSTRSARGRCISAARSIASTAPTRRRRSARRCRAAASAWSTRT